MWYGFEQQFMALVLGAAVAGIIETGCYWFFSQGVDKDPKTALKRFYVAQFLKWIFVIMLLSLCFKYTHLPPFLILMGFIAVKLFFVLIPPLLSLRQNLAFKKRALL